MNVQYILLEEKKMNRYIIIGRNLNNLSIEVFLCQYNY